MTFHEMDRLIHHRITYKPGCNIRCEHAGPEHLFNSSLTVSYQVADVKTCKEIEVCSVRYVSDAELRDMDEGMFLTMVEQLLLDMEHHEFNEWFKVDGKHVTDPHPEKKVHSLPPSFNKKDTNETAPV